MQSMLQDLKYGWRLMWRSPGFTMAAVVTLALGIGANSAIFGLINVLSLKALHYEDPECVAFVLGWDVDEQEMRFNLRLADFVDLQQQATSFDDVAAYTYLSANLTGGDLPDRVQAYRVTSNTFALLGVAAARGRVLNDADAREGHDRVAVISHGLWQRRFGGEPSIIGRRVRLNGQPHEIVGVMPPDFEFPVFNFKGDLWLPWSLRDAVRGQPAATASATVIARVRRDISYASAQSEIDTLMRAIASRFPETNRALGARLVEMGRLDDEQAGPAFTIVFVTATLVLLLACANVANLLLARGVSRHRELAMRAAIGASRWRIGRQLLIESLLLALAGGLGGVFLAIIALNALRSILPEAVLTTVPNIDQLGVDRLTLGYTLALSLATSVVFGVIPAWRAARPQVHDALKDTAATGASRRTRRLRTTLVVAEVALSVVLLVVAGLLARSYSGLQRISPGFDPHGVLTMTLSLPDYTYADAHARVRFADRALEQIARVPGVQSAGFVNVLPFSTYDAGGRLVIEGDPLPEPGREPSVDYRVASPGYLETLRIPLVIGRTFDARDRGEALPVAIVNQALARRFFGRDSALGRRVRLGRADSPWLTIVGVIGNVHHTQLTTAPAPEMFVPLAQAPPAMMMLAVRADVLPESLTGDVRAAIHAVDPAQPVYHIKTLDALLGDAMLPRSASAMLMIIFGALALTLAAIGVYGVVAYGVSQQTPEFGLRLALGATPRDLLTLVLQRGLLMVAGGVVLGGMAALGASRLMRGVLYGVSATDPITYLAVAVVLTATGLLACGVPAWRASRVQPISALRES